MLDMQKWDWFSSLILTLINIKWKLALIPKIKNIFLKNFQILHHFKSLNFFSI